MRRAHGIVNEMEFRIWRDAKSFSPLALAGTMKDFRWCIILQSTLATPSSASFLRISGRVRRTFSKGTLR